MLSITLYSQEAKRIKQFLQEMKLKIQPVNGYDEKDRFVKSLIAHLKQAKKYIADFRQYRQEMSNITDSLYKTLGDCNCLKRYYINHDISPDNINYKESLKELNKRLKAKQSEGIQTAVLSSILQRLTEIQFKEDNLKIQEKEIHVAECLSDNNRKGLLQIIRKIRSLMQTGKHVHIKRGTMSENEIRETVDYQMKKKANQKNQEIERLKEDCQNKNRIVQSMKQAYEELRIKSEEQIKELKNKLSPKKYDTIFGYQGSKKKVQMINQPKITDKNQSDLFYRSTLQNHNKSMQEELQILRSELTETKIKESKDSKIGNFQQLMQKNQSKLEQTKRILMKNNARLKSELQKAEGQVKHLEAQLEGYQSLKERQIAQGEKMAQLTESCESIKLLNAQIESLQKISNESLQLTKQQLKKYKQESSSGRSRQSLIKEIQQKDNALKKLRDNFEKELSEKNQELSKVKTEVMKLNSSLNLMKSTSEYANLKTRLQELEEKYVKEISEKEKIQCAYQRQEADLMQLRVTKKA